MAGRNKRFIAPFVCNITGNIIKIHDMIPAHHKIFKRIFVFGLFFSIIIPS